MNKIARIHFPAGIIFVAALSAFISFAQPCESNSTSAEDDLYTVQIKRRIARCYFPPCVLNVASPTFLIVIMHSGLLQNVKCITATPYPQKNYACERAIWMAQPFPESPNQKNLTYELTFYDRIKNRSAVILNLQSTPDRNLSSNTAFELGTLKQLIENQQWAHLKTCLERVDAHSPKEVAHFNNVWKSIEYAVNKGETLALSSVAKRISSTATNFPTDEIQNMVTELNNNQTRSNELLSILKENEIASKHLSRCLLAVIESLSSEDKIVLANRCVNLDDLAIAAPCHVDWKDMEGTEQIRLCG